jgi:DtxR family Mn-dependent transcriptional regulator
MALHVIRKHRLWEAFLFQVFHLSLHEIHREAELLEHQTSDFMAERINSFLGYPDFDPHGEPIPNSKGDLVFPKEQQVLSFVSKGLFYEITCLESSEKEFFDFCNNNKICIGTRLKVVDQYNKMNMTEIKVGTRKILLSRQFASIIYVKQL